MRKKDFLLAGFLLCLSFLPLLWAREGEKTYAVVSIDGEVYGEFSLTEDEEFTLRTAAGDNTLRFKGGEVAVVAADCPDKVCIKTGPKRNPGEIIACVPHKLLIEIRREE